jgi:hypothetical protein
MFENLNMACLEINCNDQLQACVSPVQCTPDCAGKSSALTGAGVPAARAVLT